MAYIREHLRLFDRSDAILACFALTLIVALLVAWPGGLLDKADHAAYAVCHRIPDRSFVFAGRPLPLCARCSGTYLGALAGIAVLVTRGRGRATHLPRPMCLVGLALFLGIWAVDGANSYLALFPDLPHLYEPHNLLRLITGTLEGLAISAVLLPIMNLTLWSSPSLPEPGITSAGFGSQAGTIWAAMAGPSLTGWADLIWLLVGGGVVVAAVSSEWPLLLYLLALISGVMVIGLVAVVNGMALLALLRRDARAQRWQEVAAPLLAGLALAMIELTAIGLLRAELTRQLGLPF